MSSNKTENYGLHLWEAADNFLRTEFNENSRLVDAALAGLSVQDYVIGSYEGDGSGARTIHLGFAPKAGFIWFHPTDGSNYYDYGLMLLTPEGCTILARMTGEGSFQNRYFTLLRCTSTGFLLDGPTITYSGGGTLYHGNVSGITYHYLALK